jgi:hypothetical protein
MERSNTYIRFDWAMKLLLRNKADYVVINGFLTSLLGEPVSIIRPLESESNRENKEDKANRVDVLVEDSKGRKFIIEIQNTNEVDFFYPMQYGISNVLAETIKKDYITISKIYYINIIYFLFGQGEGYVYHGTTELRNLLDDNDILLFPEHQLRYFGLKILDYKDIDGVFPEYYILRVNNFDEEAVRTPLEEWMYFFKTGDIPAKFSASGLPEARRRLQLERLTYADRRLHQPRHRRSQRGDKNKTIKTIII